MYILGLYIIPLRFSISLLNTSDTHKREVNHQQYILLHYLQQSANAGVIFRFRAWRNFMVLSWRTRQAMFGAHFYLERKFIEGCSIESGHVENLRAQDQVNRWVRNDFPTQLLYSVFCQVSRVRADVIVEKHHFTQYSWFFLLRL